MTSKEIVRNVFSCREAERIPRSYQANPGIDRRLKEYFGLAPEDNEGLLQKLGVDFRIVFPAYIGPRLHPEVEGRWVDPCYGIRTRWIENEFGGYMDYCDFPLNNPDMHTALTWPMPDPADYDYAAFGEACRNAGDKYVCLMNMPDVINATGMIMGMEQVLIGLVTDDKAVLTYVERRLEVQLELQKRLIEAAAGAVDCLWTGEDLGTQNTPLISLGLFRKHIRPAHQPFIDLAKEKGLQVLMHSCGSSSWAFEDFIDMGVDAVDALQPEAANMSPAYLAEKFGGRLGFHGGISTGGPLVSATPGEVAQLCRETIKAFGVGYVLAPTHMLQDNTPVENIEAMYNSINEL